MFQLLINNSSDNKAHLKIGYVCETWSQMNFSVVEVSLNQSTDRPISVRCLTHQKSS